MKTAQELLDELNAADEHVRIEAKRCSSLGKSVLETVCAYANEPGLGGGYLLLGVVPVENSFWPMYEAVGVEQLDQVQADLATQCATMFSTVTRPQIRVEQLDEKNVIVVFIPEASPHEKPVHFKNKPLPASAWRRIGSTDQQCTDDDLVVFYQSRQNESFDEQVLPDARLTDIDPEVVELYRAMRKDVDSGAEELKWSDDDLLESLKAIRKTDQGLQPTVAGVLLFGTPMALRRLFPMMRIDYIRVTGTRWVEDPDRRFDTVEIRSPLIRAINRARSSVLDDIPKAFSLPADQTQSVEESTLPERVIREVIANAVMHRDYRKHGSIQLIRYSNRLEIRNPGYSLKAPERLGDPGSDTRNPTIAAVMHDLKMAETKGSGIRVMRAEMEARQLSPPLLESDRTGNQFMAMLLFHHFLGEQDIEWLTSLGQELTNEERRAMVQAREVGAIDNSTYRDLNRDADTLTASRHLRRLCDLGLLEKRGKGAKTYYVPTDLALANWPPKPTESPELAGKSHNLDPKSHNLAPKSHNLAEQMPPDLRSRVDSLGGKSSKENIVKLILDLLVWSELSVAEVADLLGRTPNHIRRTMISEMVKADLIRPMSDTPNDPRQTYRATSVLKQIARDEQTDD